MRSNAFFSRTARRGLAAGALSLGLLGSAFAAGIQVTDAWIRWLPANLPAGGYAKVTNDTDKEIKLVGASSPKPPSSWLMLATLPFPSPRTKAWPSPRATITSC